MISSLGPDDRASTSLVSETATTPPPRHVAIIMDGNGRWAQERGWKRAVGHAQGTAQVKSIIREADRLGIRILTLYCFSTENWSRPAEEVSSLMELLKSYLISEKQELVDNNIKLQAIGQIDRIPAAIAEILLDTIQATENNSGMLLNFCISYGGRLDLLQATRSIARKVQSGELSPDQISEEVLAAHLLTKSMPDPDLVIRTSGEFRISNFLLWQMAYSEFYITDTLWPDFDTKELQLALDEFSKRKRRFGHSDEPSQGSEAEGSHA